MIILLLGPPGAGKGTQGEIIARRLGIPKLATGDVLRAAVKNGTARGREAAEYMNRGDLVPDQVILAIMKEELSTPANRDGVILDGVVRTVPQAEGLSAALRELKRNLDVVLFFEVDADELVSRLGNRTVCDQCQSPYTGREPGSKCEKCGGTLVRRADDEPAAVRRRLEVYDAQTRPVLEWFEQNGGVVKRVDAKGDVNMITTRTMEALQTDSAKE